MPAAARQPSPSSLGILRALALAASMTLAASAAHGGEAAELAERLAKVEQDLAGLDRREGDVLAVMEEIDAMVAVEAAALARAEQSTENARAAITMIEADLQQTEERIETLYAYLEPRLVSRYRLGGLGYLPVLLSTSSVPEFLSVRRKLAIIIQADIEAMREVRRLRGVLEQQHESLQSARDELEELRAGAAGRLAGLQRVRRAREASLEAIRNDRRLQERVRADVKRARRDLERRMARLAREAREESGFGALRGRLPRPVVGMVTTAFGNEASRGAQTIHKGVDIRAGRGTPVRAVAPGRVVFSDWLRGYGNLVILDHGGGYYTLMAHLERMDVRSGAEVDSGEVVGTVGDSGSTQGPQLYFEIRRGAEALDPEDWFAR